MKTKQQLQAKFKNTPVGTSLARRSVSSSFNREDTLSVKGKVPTCNNPEVNHRQHTGGQNSRVTDIVYVLNKRGLPLMPTRQQKARRLLKEGKAKVVSAFPFTIQMLVPTGENKQPITLGIDSGYLNIGFSAVTEKKELISGEVKLLKDVSKKLAERSRRQRYKLQPHDLVIFNNKKYEVKGVHGKGTYIRLVNLIRLDTKIEKVTLYQYNKGVVFNFSSRD